MCRRRRDRMVVKQQSSILITSNQQSLNFITSKRKCRRSRDRMVVKQQSLNHSLLPRESVVVVVIVW